MAGFSRKLVVVLTFLVRYFAANAIDRDVTFEFSPLHVIVKIMPLGSSER